MTAAIGLDIGATQTSGVVVDLQGLLHASGVADGVRVRSVSVDPRTIALGHSSDPVA